MIKYICIAFVSALVFSNAHSNTDGLPWKDFQALHSYGKGIFNEPPFSIQNMEVGHGYLTSALYKNKNFSGGNETSDKIALKWLPTLLGMSVDSIVESLIGKGWFCVKFNVSYAKKYFRDVSSANACVKCRAVRDYSGNEAVWSSESADLYFFVEEEFVTTIGVKTDVYD